VTIVDDEETDVGDVEELFPSAEFFENGTQPTLRQAIVAHLRGQPMMAFNIGGLVEALAHRGWLPDREDAQKRVSDMAGLMAQEKQLQRVERGVYKLHPRLAVAFDRQPVTDYRRAAEMGFAVPQPPHGDQK